MLGSDADEQTRLRARSAFREVLAQAKCFVGDREDLLREAEPLLDALWDSRPKTDPGGVPLHHGRSLFRLLARRIGLSGAEAHAALTLTDATLAAGAATGAAFSAAQQAQLLTLAFEGFTAGRDELRENALAERVLDAQVVVALAPGCVAIFMALPHTPDQLAVSLSELARRIFRVEARSVVLDLSRLHAESERSAEPLLAFFETLRSLGCRVFVPSCEQTACLQPDALAAVGAELHAHFADAQRAALDSVGFALRTRRRLAQRLLARVKR